jgi:hypothetical protein
MLVQHDEVAACRPDFFGVGSFTSWMSTLDSANSSNSSVARRLTPRVVKVSPQAVLGLNFQNVRPSVPSLVAPTICCLPSYKLHPCFLFAAANQGGGGGGGGQTNDQAAQGIIQGGSGGKIN